MGVTNRLVREVWDELGERDGNFCQVCGARDVPLIAGHIIPQHVMVLFGYKKRNEVYKTMTHFLELQCRKCDALQDKRIDWRNPKSKKLLQELLDEV